MGKFTRTEAYDKYLFLLALCDGATVIKDVQLARVLNYTRTYNKLPVVASRVIQYYLNEYRQPIIVDLRLSHRKGDPGAQVYVIIPGSLRDHQGNRINV